MVSMTDTQSEKLICL